MSGTNRTKHHTHALTAGEYGVLATGIIAVFGVVTGAVEKHIAKRKQAEALHDAVHKNS